MGDGSKRQVLVVDADEPTREKLRSIVESAGYSVVALFDERVALAYAGRAHVDVVVLDGSRSSLAKTLKADVQDRRARVVDLALLADRDDHAELLRAIAAALVVGERRQSPRYPARFGLIATASSSALGMTTRDVSRGGLAFDTSVAPNVGERMRLTIDLAVFGVAAAEVEVKNVAPTPSGWRIGAEFRDFHYNIIGFEAELARLARTAAPLP